MEKILLLLCGSGWGGLSGRRYHQKYHRTWTVVPYPAVVGVHIGAEFGQRRVTYFDCARSMSRSCASLLEPRKSEVYGFLSAARAKINWGDAKQSRKLVAVPPCRSGWRISVCNGMTLRDRPRSSAFVAQHSRFALTFGLSNSAHRWNHGNCAAACCTNGPPGRALAKARDVNTRRI